jgi:hypothetical protein
MSIPRTTELMHETNTLSSYTDLINTKSKSSIASYSSSKCTTNHFPDSPPRPMYSEAAPGTHGSSKVQTSEADKATATSKNGRTPEPEKTSQPEASSVTK